MDARIPHHNSEEHSQRGHTLTEHRDNDAHKGAIEDDSVHRRGEAADPADSNMSRAGQFGHRAGNARMQEIADGGDSDFPEPGQSPEHSGQHK
jgi:hypothetical protein